MEQWMVAAREEIRDLVTRYNANGDSGRFAQVRELFLEDATMQLETRTYRGIDEVMTIFTGTKERLLGPPAGPTAAPAYVRHFTATHQIDMVDANHAGGRLYFSVLSPAGLDHWGRYIDEYRTDPSGRWRFASREVRIDGQSPNSVLIT